MNKKAGGIVAVILAALVACGCVAGYCSRNEYGTWFQESDIKKWSWNKDGSSDNQETPDNPDDKTQEVGGRVFGDNGVEMFSDETYEVPEVMTFTGLRANEVCTVNVYAVIEPANATVPQVMWKVTDTGGRDMSEYIQITTTDKTAAKLTCLQPFNETIKLTAESVVDNVSATCNIDYAKDFDPTAIDMCIEYYGTPSGSGQSLIFGNGADCGFCADFSANYNSNPGSTDLNCYLTDVYMELDKAFLEKLNNELYSERLIGNPEMFGGVGAVELKTRFNHDGGIYGCWDDDIYIEINSPIDLFDKSNLNPLGMISSSKVEEVFNQCFARALKFDDENYEYDYPAYLCWTIVYGFDDPETQTVTVVDTYEFTATAMGDKVGINFALDGIYVPVDNITIGGGNDIILNT